MPDIDPADIPNLPDEETTMPTTWTTYPSDHDARAELRERQRADMIAEAERRAANLGLSIRCATPGEWDQGAHAGTPGGCRNTGATCLCACHDQPAPRTGTEDGR